MFLEAIEKGNISTFELRSALQALKKLGVKDQESELQKLSQEWDLLDSWQITKHVFAKLRPRLNEIDLGGSKVEDTCCELLAAA